MVSLLLVATKIMVEGCPLDSRETIPTTGGSWDGRDHQSHICCTTHVPQPLRDERAIMRIAAAIFLILGLGLHVRCEENNRDEDNGVGMLECMFEDNAGYCLRTSLARDLDRIELEVTGKKNEPPVSAVVEQAGSIIAEIVDDLRETGGKGIIEEDNAQDDKKETARGKKGDKKKKKYIQKFMGMAMMIKAKLSLLLQLISTHMQFKFFAIAILSLILNATRFWLEIKRNQPSKVIYYEHAQHQHHYDHDDHDHGYWGRSSNETPQDIAYHAHAPK
ncbi:hypothetical protein HN011_006474 [Eciton burchellii]|nr:hypothetical protein HN011_006474 [Eciton burchellii]